ncbi:MAG TPA: RNA-directed DNA polymerase [Verrucomicrobiae bacterium]|nr:RNA-directed DNA polymerase [Verrucomicrobiae bacterium]
MKIGKVKKTARQPERSLLAMTAMQARAFLRKPESYCSIELPVYFTFAPVLSAVSKELLGKRLSDMSSKPWDHEGVNYAMLSNKDGRYAWRPFQLIHPALYISLVDKITEPSQWKIIRKRFNEFQKAANFECLSIPLQASGKRKDKAAQILNWWQGIEQGSLELALEYNHVFHADITDCYAAIYTHSIAWAVHGKPEAKAKKKDPSLIGNVIDTHIQNMRHGQTNGIPQGSVLMDFIAELVLGYADLELHDRLKASGITGFRILRYRDDYRIFVNSPQIGEAILKALTEVLIDLGLKLNTSKTTGSQFVVAHALKPDKRTWLRGRQGDANLQKHLLIIHAHGQDFPNAGSLTVALTHFHERLTKLKRIANPRVLISIATDIAYHSPRAFPFCSAIASKLLTALKSKSEKVDTIQKIYAKLSQLPNTGHMEVWLQRISHSFIPQLGYKEALCKLANGELVTIWNNDWITSPNLKAALDLSTIVNKAKLRSLKPVVKPKEIAVFNFTGYY